MNMIVVLYGCTSNLYIMYYIYGTLKFYYIYGKSLRVYIM